MDSRTPPNSMEGPSGSRKTRHIDTPTVLHVHRVSSCDKCCVSTNILPDDVLLLVFRLDRVIYLNGLEGVSQCRPYWRWHRLAHVSRRWRSVVFASPNFLDLRLVCNPRTRMELIGIWPPLPIAIKFRLSCSMPEDYDFDAAIVHHNRICEIEITLKSSQLQRLAPAMQEQFPVLTRLSLRYDSIGSHHLLAPALPDRFLGGSAPRLQFLGLDRIPFPALPKLLLSATDLVYLYLHDIPHSGYMSPEAVVTGLAVSANLKALFIEFESLQSRPNRESRCPPPSKRTVLPALTRFESQGVVEWLEDLVARIDAPLLNTFWISFFYQLILDTSHLVQFMRRTTMFQTFDEAHVYFSCYGSIQVGSLPWEEIFYKRTALNITCEEIDQQFPSLVQILTSFFPSIYVVEHLYIRGFQDALEQWEVATEDTRWLKFFRPFNAVKNLYVCKNSAPRIAPALGALQELVGERVTNVLPALESLFLEELDPSGTVQEALGKFVAARQLLGHTVAVIHLNEAVET